MKPNFTDAQLDGLTDEEREGLMDDTLVDDDHEIIEGEIIPPAGTATPAAAAAQAEVEEEDEDEGEGDDDDAAQVAAAAATPAATTPVIPPAAVAAAAEAGTEIQLDTRKASWLDVDTLKSQKDDLTKQLRDLSVKFDNGDLTAEELHEQREAIEAKRDPINTQLMRADINKADAIERWKEETVPGFFAKNSIYAEKGSILNTMLDAEVRKIQSTAANPLDPKILDLAHQRISAQLKQATGAEPPKTAPGKKPAKVPKPEMPPTLGGVPAAAGIETEDGTEFAQLDRLQAKDPMAYEDALGKLSAAQLDYYLSR